MYITGIIDKSQNGKKSILGRIWLGQQCTGAGLLTRPHGPVGGEALQADWLRLGLGRWLRLGLGRWA